MRTSLLTRALAQRGDQPRAVAAVALARAVYGDHPYGRTGEGDARRRSPSITTATTWMAFHDRAFRPSNAALVVVGATTWDEVRPRLEAAFGAGGVAQPRGR